MPEEELEKYEKGGEFRSKNKKQMQLEALRGVSELMLNSTSKFDIDESANQKHSKFDKMIKQSMIQKCLEKDELIFMEGSKDR